MLLPSKEGSSRYSRGCSLEIVTISMITFFCKRVRSFPEKDESVLIAQ
jgi:hypothetical protein